MESDRLISKILESKDPDLARPCSSHISGVADSRNHMLQIFGTALATDDLALTEVDHMTRLGWFNKEEITKLRMDAATVFIALP